MQKFARFVTFSFPVSLFCFWDIHPCRVPLFLLLVCVVLDDLYTCWLFALWFRVELHWTWNQCIKFLWEFNYSEKTKHKRHGWQSGWDLSIYLERTLMLKQEESGQLSINWGFNHPHFCEQGEPKTAPAWENQTLADSTRSLLKSLSALQLKRLIPEALVICLDLNGVLLVSATRHLVQKWLGLSANLHCFHVTRIYMRYKSPLTCSMFCLLEWRSASSKVDESIQFLALLWTQLFILSRKQKPSFSRGGQKSEETPPTDLEMITSNK